MDVVVDLYEMMSSHNLVYFNRTRLFWDAMATEFAEKDVSLRIVTVHDAAWANGGYEQSIKTHIRCEKAPFTQPMQAVEIKRGFIIDEQ